MTDDNQQLAVNFFAAFGRLMVKGLNDLPEGHRRMIAQAQQRGCRVIAVCRADPPTLVAAIEDPSNGEAEELFSVFLPETEPELERLH